LETGVENGMMLGCTFRPSRRISRLAYPPVPEGGPMHRTRILAAIFALVCLAVAAPLASAQGKRAITFDDLISFHRVSSPQISPDGKWVAYVVSTPDKEANRSASNLWLVPVAGGEPRQLTRSGRDSRPRWSPDGKKIAFVSRRDGAPQIFTIALEGGEASRLTNISTGASEVLWSPDGAWLAFVSEVYPDCGDDACNSKRDAEREKSKVKARVYDRLLYRHWDTWEDGKRSHLFVVSADGKTVRDLTPGADYDVPPFSLGGPEPIAFSPDGKELCFTANTDKDEALSTNADLFVVPVAGGEPRRITGQNRGYDGGPVYSPDGRWIAYRAQMKYGYESDRWRLMLYDRKSGQHVNLTEAYDRNVEGFVWSPDSRWLYFQSEDRGYLPILRLSATPARSGNLRPEDSGPQVVLGESYHPEFDLASDGRTLVFTRTNLAMPAELHAANADGSGVRQLTQHNAAKLAPLEMNKAEHFWFESSDGARIHGMLIRPPQFDAAKKYPLLLLCHGGPQTMWSDAFGYRWNAQVMAAPGYVVAMINRRGSTGFGQKFVDEINADWGGKAFEDLMKGVDFVLAKYPFVDGNRMAAAGGSYGGFMANWLASQSKGRFKALISHAGVYNFESMYGSTEELWFVEWDLRGTPWTNPADYAKQSPHKFAADIGKYKTPTLVIHGEHDYRVPYTEGLQMFTALQRQGVPSKLLFFPDEGHWILKPQNSELWYRTFLDWLAQWLK
jgi:dipeptidyl aminopeptidase/acylaminoacyl peptidase